MAWIFLVAGAILGILLDELYRFARKKYAEKNPFDIDYHFITVPARLATPDELDSFECPNDVSAFDYIVNSKNGVWCGKVFLRLKIRNKSMSRIEIDDFKFVVTDSETCHGATIYFATAGANEALGFVVNLDEECPKADRCRIENGHDYVDRPDYFGHGNSISLVPEETCNIELLAKVEHRCRTFTMDIEYSINGKPKRLENVFKSSITVTPFESSVFKQSLVCLPGKRTLTDVSELAGN